MPEQLEPEEQHQPNTSEPRRAASRRLSRSPHPYHRQQSELAHSSEKFRPTTPASQTPLRSVENTDEDRKDGARVANGRFRGSANSDSGTEADDEHFLKGLPAPKLKLHKGLRGAEGSLSGSPSPILSPALFDDDEGRKSRLRTSRPSTPLKEDDLRKAAEKFRQKRKVEIIRRTTEVGILAFVGGILCLDPEIRRLIYLWKRELTCQCLVISSLIVIYPLRLLRHMGAFPSWRSPIRISIPASFDPAPLLYPPIIATLVSFLLSRDRPACFLPTLILGIASLPRDLIPSTGGLEGLNTTQWFLSSIPLLVAKSSNTSGLLLEAVSHSTSLKPELLILIPPLHQSLCTTLNALTTTSLLPAELQLLSIALINLLFLAKSPQAIILKSLLWGGGIGVLVTCAKVLKWGVVLARIPRWRFRRAEPLLKSSTRKVLDAKKPFSTRSSVFARNATLTDSDEVFELEPTKLNLKLNTSVSAHVGHGDNASFSALEPNSHANGSMTLSGMADSFRKTRRHTLPSQRIFSPFKATERTSSGRKKRSASSSIQAFFHLTQSEATTRKWLYAGYVYLCLLAIILFGIREYVARYALSGDEPVGWALGYLLGDLPWFRMQVVSGNFQRWIRLPPRSGLEHQESCHKGWVEHLRHASFGEANTRLILCAYWLAIIVVGLAIVLRLSSVYEVDTRRKVFHFMMVAMLLPATYVDPAFAALALSLMLAIFLLLDLFRASQLPPLSKSLAYFLTPYVDGRDLKGPVVISHIFLLIGCAIPLWLSLASLPRTGTDALAGWEIPTREVSMVSGVICVGMGDAAASLIGRRYGRRKWLWGGGKSIEGSVAFATAVGLALLLAKAWLRIGGWAGNNTDSWIMTIGKAGVAAWVASLTEAVLTGGNDNVVVPVVLWLCTKGLDI